MNSNEILFGIACILLNFLAALLIGITMYARRYDIFFRSAGILTGIWLSYNLCSNKLVGAQICALITVAVCFWMFFGSTDIRKNSNRAVAAGVLLIMSCAPVYIILQQGLEDAGHRIDRISETKIADLSDGAGLLYLHVMFMENGDVLKELSRSDAPLVTSSVIEYYYAYPTGELMLRELDE